MVPHQIILLFIFAAGTYVPEKKLVQLTWLLVCRRSRMWIVCRYRSTMWTVRWRSTVRTVCRSTSARIRTLSGRTAVLLQTASLLSLNATRRRRYIPSDRIGLYGSGCLWGTGHRSILYRRSYGRLRNGIRLNWFRFRW